MQAALARQRKMSAAIARQRERMVAVGRGGEAMSREEILDIFSSLDDDRSVTEG